MSQYQFYAPHQSSLPSQSAFSANLTAHNHHGNRSRRSARYSTSQNSNSQRQFKNPRTQKETAEALLAAALRKDFEAARSFELDDDEVFCPWHLLTDDDLQSIHSASSDRSSTSSGSPDSSPLQPQLQPTPSFSLNNTLLHHQTIPTSFQQASNAHLKIHQPLAQRTRNAIPIVDPNSRNASPPTSISPARLMHKAAYVSRRW